MCVCVCVCVSVCVRLHACQCDYSFIIKNILTCMSRSV